MGQRAECPAESSTASLSYVPADQLCTLLSVKQLLLALVPSSRSPPALPRLLGVQAGEPQGIHRWGCLPQQVSDTSEKRFRTAWLQSRGSTP